jgi:hypothetical protein
VISKIVWLNPNFIIEIAYDRNEALKKKKRKKEKNNRMILCKWRNHKMSLSSLHYSIFGCFDSSIGYGRN